MRRIFIMIGVPVIFLSDIRPCFINEGFNMFMHLIGIWHVFSAPCHPSSKGQGQCTVCTFKEAIKVRENREGTLKVKIKRSLHAFRTFLHSANRFFLLNYCSNIILPCETKYPEAIRRINIK